MQILTEIFLWLIEPLRWLLWVYIIVRLSLFALIRKLNRMRAETFEQIQKTVLG